VQTRAWMGISRACPAGCRTICREGRRSATCLCALFAAKDTVNVFLYDGAIVPDPEGTVAAGPDNKTARTVTVRKARGSTCPRTVPCFGRLPTTGGRRKRAFATHPGPLAWETARPSDRAGPIDHRNVSGTMVSDRDPSIRDYFQLKANTRVTTR
jgi:hypothetical protein